MKIIRHKIKKKTENLDHFYNKSRRQEEEIEGNKHKKTRLYKDQKWDCKRKKKEK